MSLRSALQRLSSDRDAELALRNILAVMSHHREEWMAPGGVATSAGVAREHADQILSELKKTFVLDFDDTTRGYRLRKDGMIDIEIDQYMRRIDSHSGSLQSNVEKFRRRYGSS